MFILEYADYKGITTDVSQIAEGGALKALISI